MSSFDIFPSALLALFSFGLSYFSLKVCIWFAFQKDILDHPGPTKPHATPTPLLGGLGIVFSLLGSISIASICLPDFSLNIYFPLALLLFCLVGLRDDIRNSSIWGRVLKEVTICLLFSTFSPWKLTSLYGIFGIGELPLMISILLTSFVIFSLVNAHNLIDGSDGLSATIGMMSAILFASLFFRQGDFSFFILALLYLGALLAFFIFNFPPAKMFLGDAGSLSLGFIHSVFAIQFIESSPLSTELNPAYAPLVAISILILPIFDTIRVFSLRILKGQSPLRGDLQHFHHYLKEVGASARQILLSTVILTLCSFVMTLLIFSKLNFWIALLGLLAQSFIMIFICAKLLSIKNFK